MLSTLTTVNYAFLFSIGAFIGSFLNLVSDRVVLGEKIVFGRSHCDKCGESLKVKNLIPIFSFLFQRGKCDKCKVKLSWFYPVSEALAGALFVLAALISKFSVFDPITFNGVLGFGFLAVVFSFYLILLLTDLKYMLIPDKIVLAGVAFVFVFNLFTLIYSLITYRAQLAQDPFGTYLLQVGFFQDQAAYAIKNFGVNIASSLGISLFFLFLVWITKGRGMGGGDIRLGLLIGLVNGFPYNILAVFFGFLFGSIVSLVLVLFKRKTLKSTVPFGPFLIVGSLVCFLWGSQILNWYINLF